VRRALKVIVGCILLLSAAGARADDGEAESLIVKGLELREKGRDEEALALFKKAYAKTPSPRARAQVALAEQALGMWVAAEADLVAALSSESDAWIAKNKAALEGALGVIRRHVGGIEVRGADGAEVRIDGVVAGTAQAGNALRVEAGKRTLEVRQKGFQSTTRAIEIPPGGVARETVTLVAVSTNEDGTAPTPPRERDRDHNDDPGQGQRLLGWAFIGTGGALLVTGAVGLLVRKGIVDDYNTNCPGLGASQPAGCDDKVESARTWLTVSIVSLVAGGVFALGGTALMVTAPSAEKKNAWLSCTFGGCAGTF